MSEHIMSDIPALIAELRNAAGDRQHLGTNAGRFDRAAAALEAQVQRITELQAEAVDLRRWWGRSVPFGEKRQADYDEALLRAQRAEAERDALAAVIEAARECLEQNEDRDEVAISILSGSPSGVLDRVKAEALREAAQAMEDVLIGKRATLGMPTYDWLRAEAARIEKGEA